MLESGLGTTLEFAAARLSDDESWVVIDISGTVKRVLYTRKGHIDANSALALTDVRGGEMKVGPVLLKVGGAGA